MSESIDAAPILNANLDGWCSANGLRFLRATASGVSAEWTVGPQQLQAYGIVHGGVHCGVIETLTSVGAAVFALRAQAGASSTNPASGGLRVSPRSRSGRGLYAVAALAAAGWTRPSLLASRAPREVPRLRPPFRARGRAGEPGRSRPSSLPRW